MCLFGMTFYCFMFFGYMFTKSCHGAVDYEFDILAGHSFADINVSQVKRSMLACAKSCAQNAGSNQCNMALYDKGTRLCSMKFGDSEDIVPVSDNNKVVAVITELIPTTTTTSTTTTSTTTTTPPLPISQWVNSVLSFSSEWKSNGDCSAYQVIGAPDVYPSYGSISEAWAPLTDNAAEFLELSFLTSVHVTGIAIYENNLGGAVSAVKCYQNGGYTTLWTSVLIERITIARIFQPQLATGCFSNRVKLEIAPISGWVNIDAVQLDGYV